MKRELPTVYDFMMVESLAHHESIRLAAKELELSPSALSRQLSSLEAKVGIRIFDRDTRNFSISSSGKEFVQTAKKILSATEELMGSFNSHLDARLGRLTIATMSSVGAILLPKLLLGFRKKHPGIDLTVNDELSSNIVSMVYSGDADLGFTAGSPELRSKLSFLPLIEDYFTVVSSRSDPNLTKESYTLEELVRYPHISSKKGNSHRDIVESLCQIKNLEFVPAIECSHMTTAVGMASEGLGIVLVPTVMLPAFKTEKIKFHKISDLPKFRKIGLAYPTGKSLSPAANHFIRHAREEVSSLYQLILKEHPG